MLSCRLVLNLRRLPRILQRQGDQRSTWQSTTINDSGLRFATNTLLGNIGAPLRSGDDTDIEEEDGDDDGGVGYELECSE